MNREVAIGRCRAIGKRGVERQQGKRRVDFVREGEKRGVKEREGMKREERGHVMS